MTKNTDAQDVSLQTDSPSRANAQRPAVKADLPEMEKSMVIAPRKSLRKLSSASRYLSSDRDLIFLQSFWDKPLKLALILLTCAGVSVVAFSVPETLLPIRLATIWKREVGMVIPLLAVIPIGLYLWLLYDIYNQRYIVGLETVTKLNGVALFFRTSALQSYLSDIRSIELERSMCQRICNIGDIIICSIGSENPEIVLKGVQNPKMVKGIIEHRRHQFKLTEKHADQESHRERGASENISVLK